MAQADWRFDGCWCKRVEVRPLSYDGKAIPKAAEARAALQKVTELPDSEVSPTEKCMLCLAIVAPSERVARDAGERAD